MYNNSPVRVRIEALHLDWPPENEKLKKIELAGEKIYDHDDLEPPTDIPAEHDWNGSPSRRNIDAFSDKKMVIFFDHDAVPGGYVLILFFDNGCELTAGA